MPWLRQRRNMSRNMSLSSQTKTKNCMWEVLILLCKYKPPSMFNKQNAWNQITKTFINILLGKFQQSTTFPLEMCVAYNHLLYNWRQISSDNMLMNITLHLDINDLWRCLDSCRVLKTLFPSSNIPLYSRHQTKDSIKQTLFAIRNHSFYYQARQNVCVEQGNLFLSSI